MCWASCDWQFDREAQGLVLSQLRWRIKMVAATKGVTGCGKCWPVESSDEEERALLRECKNLRLSGSQVRKTIKVVQAGASTELTRSEGFNPWMVAKLVESNFQTRQCDYQCKSIL